MQHVILYGILTDLQKALLGQLRKSGYRVNIRYFNYVTVKLLKDMVELWLYRKMSYIFIEVTCLKYLGMKVHEV